LDEDEEHDDEEDDDDDEEEDEVDEEELLLLELLLLLLLLLAELLEVDELELLLLPLDERLETDAFDSASLSQSSRNRSWSSSARQALPQGGSAPLSSAQGPARSSLSSAMAALGWSASPPFTPVPLSPGTF